MPQARLTPTQRKQAEEALATAREPQTAFWDDLRELEELLGLEISAEDDLAETSLDHLLSNRNHRQESRR